MTSVNLSARIDTSGLNRGIALALQYSKRTPAQLVNTAGAEIAINAKYHMPFVTIPKIDTELNVAVPIVAKKRGAGLRRGLKFQRENRVVGNISGRDVPLAVLIIQARVTAAKRGAFGPRSSSNYNQLTGFRYARHSSPFADVTRSQGRAAMRAAVTRMINSRHSSIKFLQAGWIPAVQILLPLSVNRYRRGSSTGPPLEGQRNYFGANLGTATPATPGALVAMCVIENNIGYTGRNAASFDRALQLHGLAPLQRAVDDEGARNMQYWLDKSAQVELFEPFNRVCA